MTTPRDDTAIVDIKIRMKEPLRAQIEKAATDRGVSMNAEMVERLRASFADEKRRRGLFDALTLAYGPRTAGLALMIARAMHDAGTRAGFTVTHTLEGSANWIDDPRAFGQAAQAVAQLMKAAAPAGDPTMPSMKFENEPNHPLTYLNKNLGKIYANNLIDVISGNSTTPELTFWAKPLRPMLGALGKRMKHAIKGTQL